VLIIIGLVVAFIFYQRHQSAQMQIMLRIKELELQQAQLQASQSPAKPVETKKEKKK
jgi:hypothetical protein